MKKELMAQLDPKSPISEIFRTLRTNIQFMSNNKRLKALLVTSTFQKKKKSWTTSNLAVTFAQAGKRVVLVDADMRKGRQYSIFGVSPKPGLSNLLAEIDDEKDVEEQILDYVQQTEVENLYIITAGNVPPNPSELLVSSQMSTVLQGLKQICDIVIIDGTPCELVTDSVILSRIVDATIIVTAYKQTKKDALQRIVKNIKNVGGKVAGVIVNKVPTSSKKYGEKYYYYGNETLPVVSKKNQDDITRRAVNQARRNEVDNRHKETDEIKRNTNTSEDANSKTNDILKQINSYLENEKKDL